MVIEKVKRFLGKRRDNRTRKRVQKEISQAEARMAAKFPKGKRLTVVQHLEQARVLIPKKGLSEENLSDLVMVKGHLHTLDDLFKQNHESLTEDQHKTLVGLHHVLGSKFNQLGHQALSEEIPNLRKAQQHFKLAEEHLSHVQTTLKQMRLPEAYYQNLIDEWNLDSLEDLGQKIAEGKEKHASLSGK